MKTKVLTTTFTQTVPNLDASDALQYPSIDRNVTFQATSTAADTIKPPVRSYAIIPKPTWARTSSFTIHSSSPGSSSDASNPVYTALIQRERHGFGSSQIILQSPTTAAPETAIFATTTVTNTLATCRFKGFANKKFLFLGQHPDCTDLADWIPVTPSAKFDPSRFSFEVGGSRFAWVRTRRKEFGGQGWMGKNFKLVRLGWGEGGEDGKGQVLAVYVHVGKWKRRDEGRVDWFCEFGEGGIGEEVERLGLVLVMGLQEEIRRKE